MGFPEQEITVTGTVKEERDGRVVVETEAEQGGNRIIRNAEAELADRLSRSLRRRARHNRTVEITARQSFILRKVVEGHVALDQPVGSKWIAEQDDMPWGPSTVRAELARLEEIGLLEHPHTSAGRVPTDRGYRFYVDELLAEGRLPVPRKAVELVDMRREVDEAMRATTEQLSQVTNLLALVTAPPIETATIRHVEVLLLQPQVAMVVVITSTGGVTKRVISYDEPVDPGLVDWAASYLNEALGGLDVGSRLLQRAARRPAALASASARSSPRSRRPSPSSRRPPRARSSWTAPRGCCPSTASRSCRRSASMLEVLEHRAALLGAAAPVARRAERLPAHRRGEPARPSCAR